MIAAVVLSLAARLPAHVPGLSQGDVVVDGAGDDVGVEVDVVFARGDAARLLDPFVVVTAGGDACAHDPVDGAFVEGDGRALRLQAHCRGAGDLVVDVVGLRALPPEHRMALRVVDDGGTHDFLLSPEATQATLPRASAARMPSRSALSIVVGALVVAVGARRTRAFVTTLGYALVGVGVGLLVRSLSGVVADADVVAVVRVVAAALAVVGVVVDPAPRARIAALALAALAP